MSKKLINIGSKVNSVFQLILVSFLALSVFFGVILANNRQDIREKASVIGGLATVSIEPNEGSYAIGDTIESAVYFSSASIPVSGIAVSIIYPYSGSNPEVSVSDISINPDFSGSGDWVCPTQESHLEGGFVKINIACANTTATGFVAEKTLLAKISLKVISIPFYNPLSVRFDPQLSVITQKSNNQDILAIPTSSALYYIGDIISPTPTGKKVCSIKLYPASFNLRLGEITTMKVELEGKKATSVKFHSNSNDLLIEPTIDTKTPYETTIRPVSLSSQGPVLVTTQALLGKKEICHATAVVNILTPVSATPKLLRE